MGHWFVGLLILLVGLFGGDHISQTQDVGLYGRDLTSELNLYDSIAPQFTASLASNFNWARFAQDALLDPNASPKQLLIPSGLRVMVFSPHPDDESLAAGGIIQRVLQKGGQARVVFMTNGDGYVEGVRSRVRLGKASSSDFVEYGKLRQEEAVQALCELGLTPQDGLFFGFPDDGIDDLWSSNWSRLRPYTSPHTRSDHSPYQESFSRWLKYAGVDLEENISRALREFAPDWVIIPDPRDEHPDHACTGVFVLDTLRKLNQNGGLSFNNTQVFTYLVHYKDYPTSERWLRTIRKAGIARSLTSVGVLSRTHWVSLPLTPEELVRKRRALAAHQSQFEILGGFFKIYVRPTEVFGRLEPVQVLAVPQEYAAPFNRPSI